VVAASFILAYTISFLFNTQHTAIYMILFTSSSTAVIMPIIQSLHLKGGNISKLLPQIAIADAGCIIAVPLVMGELTLGTIVGVVIIIAASIIIFYLLWLAQKRGLQKKLERISKRRGFAMELRISLLLLLALAALAQMSGISIMLAGFGLGMAVAGAGEPRRLARQLFGMSEGFFSPIFFIWLGAKINLRDLLVHPNMIILAVVLAAAAIGAHMVTGFLRQPVRLGILAASQNGVPAAIVALGASQLLPGESAALLLASLITLAAAVIAARSYANSGKNSPIGSHVLEEASKGASKT